MKLELFTNLFVRKIQCIYDAEQQIIEAMPTVIDLCTSQELQQTLQKHFDETERQIEKIEMLADELNIELEGSSNLGMEGLIDDMMDLLAENEKSPILDAAIIASAQEIEHYEIGSYGTAAEWAEQLGFDNAKKVLAEIMNEEKTADALLSQLAETLINKEAIETNGQIAMGRMG